MGQVEELFGNSKGAVVHYRKAHSVNEFSSVQTYKLAESLRKSGDAKGSIVYYEKLEKRLETAVGEFDRQGMKSLLASVRSGMAEAMLDAGEPTDKVLAVLAKLEDFDETSRKRGARVLHRVISKYPNNQEARKYLGDDVLVYANDINPSLSAACNVADYSFQICKVSDDNYI